MRHFLIFLFLAGAAVPAYAADTIYLRALAEQGDAGAEIALGASYLEQNPAEADFWAVLAQNNSHDTDTTKTAIDLQNKAGQFLSHAQKMDVQNRANAWHSPKRD